MMSAIADVFSKVIGRVTEKTGRVISLIALPIMLIIALEVIARYFFNSPTRWAWPLSTHLFGVLALFGGAYALLHGSHIRVEVFYERFGPRLRLVSSVLYAVCFLLFIGLLVWQGYELAEMSVRGREVIRGIIHFPVYPLKILVPVAALLFLLQGIAILLRRKTKQRSGDPITDPDKNSPTPCEEEKNQTGLHGDDHLAERSLD
jgi:TRAP-type mannitol/chloroaromatic compound transport system permease small subunit